MAIPLIIGVAAAAAGVYKTGKAISDNNDAENIHNEARRIFEQSEKKLNQSRDLCEQALQELGATKASILENEVNQFINTYEKIKNIEFTHNELVNLNAKDFSHTLIKEMKASVSFIEAAGLGMGGGAVSGALTAFGAYNATMALAAAGTGTAISSLSGAAATNATLAWLGGGTLASGGMGVAGGTLALGALAAGPALLVAGWYMGAKAEENLSNAKTNLEKANKYAADIDAAVAITDGISNVANLGKSILLELREYAQQATKALIRVIAIEGNNYQSYSEEAKMIVLKNIKIIQVIKATMDTPILDKEGNLLGDAKSNLAAIHTEINSENFLQAPSI